MLVENNYDLSLECKCGFGSQFIQIDSGYLCKNCTRQIRLTDGIFIDSNVKEIDNALEEIDYNSLHGVSETASIHLGQHWFRLIKSEFISCDDLSLLEIGAGSGMLSTGLAHSTNFKRFIITDISSKFLRINFQMMKESLHRNQRGFQLDKISFISTSIDDLPFKSCSFDVIVANSVLHHLFDVELALLKLKRILRPGGIAIFSEPVIQGKAFIGFFANLIAELDNRSPKPLFNDFDRQKLTDLGTLCSTKFWKQQAYAVKDTANDKHLFCIDELKILASDLGFTSFCYSPYGPITDGLYEIMLNSLTLLDINLEPLSNYRYVFDLFQSSVIQEIPTKVFTPHAFITFKK